MEQLSLNEAEVYAEQTAKEGDGSVAPLLNYLRGGRLELSNNWAGRSIKPFVIEW